MALGTNFGEFSGQWTPQDEAIKDENLFLKMKLLASFGTELEGPYSLPAKVENQLLKIIMQMEGCNEEDLVSLYDLIGRPILSMTGSIPEAILGKKVQELLSLLEVHGITLSFLGEYSPRCKYKFITEEFLQEKICPGISSEVNLLYIYEDFHPNARLDLKYTAEMFFESLISGREPELLNFLHEQVQLPEGKINKLNALSVIDPAKWASKYEKADFNVSIISFEFAENKGQAEVRIEPDSNNGSFENVVQTTGEFFTVSFIFDSHWRVSGFVPPRSRA